MLGRMRFDPGNPIPRRQDFGRGFYRRRIEMRAQSDAVVADLEDDFHRLRLRIHHDDAAVRRVEGEALRVPWTTCASATEALERLVGLPLTRSHRAVALRAEPRLQCTHLFDLACAAVGLAADGARHRRFDLCVADRPREAGVASIARDGCPLFEWSIEGAVIRSPEPFAGRAMVGGGFAAWCEEALDPDLAEAAQLLRRGVLVGMGRVFQMDTLSRASEIPGGTCHTFQPGTMERGLRIAGSTRDFSERPEALLADLQAGPDPGD